MGGDYYIDKNLVIKFINCIDIITIELEHDRGYFLFYEDKDDPDYDTKYRKYMEETLLKVMKPITIYENNQFVTTKLEDKYKALIETELNLYKKKWKYILEIVKEEVRYESD